MTEPTSEAAAAVDLDDDLRLAFSLANTADELTLARWRAHDLRVERKPDRTPVTDADLAVEDAIRARLATDRPADEVVGEERGGTGSTGRAWLLDPIDGTKNFLRGMPVWASLLALVVAGRPVVGVISAPALGRRWWAAAGVGAYASERGSSGRGDPSASGAADRKLAVSAVRDLADCYVSTTDPGSWTAHPSRRGYLALVDACWQSRAFGDFWQHCLVAEGAIDLAVEPVVNSWDVAAVQVLVEQAGGQFSDLRHAARHDGGDALSSNGLLHDAALDLLGRPERPGWQDRPV